MYNWWVRYEYRIRHWDEHLLMWVAWRLPPELIKWCYVRVIATATTEKFADKTPHEVSIMDALAWWSHRHERENRHHIATTD